MTYFLDTNICIFYLNNSSPNVVHRIDTAIISGIKIPSVVAAELFYGAMKSVKREYNLSRFQLFLEQFEIVSFDFRAAAVYGNIRNDLESRGQIIGGNDLMIASTVLADGGVFVTNNVKEFSRIQDLKIENWTAE